MWTSVFSLKTRCGRVTTTLRATAPWGATDRSVWDPALADIGDPQGFRGTEESLEKSVDTTLRAPTQRMASVSTSQLGPWDNLARYISPSLEAGSPASEGLQGSCLHSLLGLQAESAPLRQDEAGPPWMFPNAFLQGHSHCMTVTPVTSSHINDLI